MVDSMKVSSNVWMSCEIWGIETTEKIKHKKYPKQKQKKKQQRNRENSGMLYVNISWNLSTWFWHVCTSSPVQKLCAVDMYLVMTVEIFPVRYVCENKNKKTQQEVFLIWLYCDRYIHQLGTQQQKTQKKNYNVFIISDVKRDYWVVYDII